jgi:hypothetical protein
MPIRRFADSDPMIPIRKKRVVVAGEHSSVAALQQQSCGVTTAGPASIAACNTSCAISDSEVPLRLPGTGGPGQAACRLGSSAEAQHDNVNDSS